MQNCLFQNNVELVEVELFYILRGNLILIIPIDAFIDKTIFCISNLNLQVTKLKT